MSRESDEEAGTLENVDQALDGLAGELNDLYTFRNMFFENHPLELAAEKNKLIEEKKDILIAKFEEINETQIPLPQRARFMYMKGKCFNISPVYDPRASQCLSKAVKLDPHMLVAWNELGECHWKNLNVKEAKASFEGALKHERNSLSLRCLSIILRQEHSDRSPKESAAAITKSVEIAKEAVALDIKDGISWLVLGNAYLCQFFLVSQDPAMLKSCMSAYKQAWLDPIAKGQPDLYYNRGIALKYEEQYAESLEDFKHACRLDPPWEPPQKELARLSQYLTSTNELVLSRGKIKTKKLTQMVQNIDRKMLGIYSPGTFHKFGSRADVMLEYTTLDRLHEGTNECKAILGKVVGSIRSEVEVPFTFAIVDESMECVSVTVYNWANGRGTIIGDCVCIPEPKLFIHKNAPDSDVLYNFKSIRVDSPLLLLVNGKRVSRDQFACIKVTSSYEIH